eukprot:1394570-Amorphochlora_amoeboformis.AAC.1
MTRRPSADSAAPLDAGKNSQCPNLAPIQPFPKVFLRSENRETGLNNSKVLTVRCGLGGFEELIRIVESNSRGKRQDQPDEVDEYLEDEDDDEDD